MELYEYSSCQGKSVRCGMSQDGAVITGSKGTDSWRDGLLRNCQEKRPAGDLLGLESALLPG